MGKPTLGLMFSDALIVMVADLVASEGEAVRAIAPVFCRTVSQIYPYTSSKSLICGF